jgi:soluble lytic murein transglycosylase-like protein
VDGLSQVQSRIAEIQARFQMPVPRTGTSADWTSAAAAAGLDGAGPVSDWYGTAGGTGSESAVVAEAAKYLGVPYLWGGTDPAKGLDCSGFVQLVYGNLGIDLPRVSSQQATAGRPVASLAEARPGDLVFFDHSSSRPGIDHVGIYIGNGQMIAAPQPGETVKVQAVGNPTVIRRVLPEAAAGSVAAPSGSALAGVPYADLFTRAGNRYGVAPSLLAAVASQESGFNSGAVSSAGAQGLMQFMPATARGLGVNPLDPAQAIDGAARMLKHNLNEFGSLPLALAAYNAGGGAVHKYGGIPPFAETQAYVPKVQAALAALS